MTPLLLVRQLNPVAATIMLFIVRSFVHAIENGSSPHCSLLIRPVQIVHRTM